MQGISNTVKNQNSSNTITTIQKHQIANHVFKIFFSSCQYAEQHKQLFELAILDSILSTIYSNFNQDTFFFFDQFKYALNMEIVSGNDDDDDDRVSCNKIINILKFSFNWIKPRLKTIISHGVYPETLMQMSNLILKAKDKCSQNYQEIQTIYRGYIQKLKLKFSQIGLDYEGVRRQAEVNASQQFQNIAQMRRQHEDEEDQQQDQEEKNSPIKNRQSDQIRQLLDSGVIQSKKKGLIKLRQFIKNYTNSYSVSELQDLFKALCDILYDLPSLKQHVSSFENQVLTCIEDFKQILPNISSIKQFIPNIIAHFSKRLALLKQAKQQNQKNSIFRYYDVLQKWTSSLTLSQVSLMIHRAFSSEIPLQASSLNYKYLSSILKWWRTRQLNNSDKLYGIQQVAKSFQIIIKGLQNGNSIKQSQKIIKLWFNLFTEIQTLKFIQIQLIDANSLYKIFSSWYDKYTPLPAEQKQIQKSKKQIKSSKPVFTPKIQRTSPSPRQKEKDQKNIKEEVSTIGNLDAILAASQSHVTDRSGNELSEDNKSVSRFQHFIQSSSNIGKEGQHMQIKGIQDSIIYEEATKQGEETSKQIHDNNNNIEKQLSIEQEIQKYDRIVQKIQAQLHKTQQNEKDQQSGLTKGDVIKSLNQPYKQLLDKESNNNIGQRKQYKIISPSSPFKAQSTPLKDQSSPLKDQSPPPKQPKKPKKSAKQQKLQKQLKQQRKQHQQTRQNLIQANKEYLLLAHKNQILEEEKRQFKKKKQITNPIKIDISALKQQTQSRLLMQDLSDDEQNSDKKTISTGARKRQLIQNYFLSQGKAPQQQYRQLNRTNDSFKEDKTQNLSIVSYSPYIQSERGRVKQSSRKKSTETITCASFIENQSIVERMAGVKKDNKTVKKIFQTNQQKFDQDQSFQANKLINDWESRQGILMFQDLLLRTQDGDRQIKKPLLYMYTKLGDNLQRKVKLVNGMLTALDNEDILFSIKDSQFKSLIDVILIIYSKEKNYKMFSQSSMSGNNRNVFDTSNIMGSKAKSNDDNNEVMIKSQKLLSIVLNSKEFTTTLSVLLQLITAKLPYDLTIELDNQNKIFIRVCLRCISQIIKELAKDENPEDCIRVFEVMYQLNQLFIKHPPQKLNEKLPSISELNFIYQSLKCLTDTLLKIQPVKAESFIKFIDERKPSSQMQIVSSNGQSNHSQTAFVKYVRAAMQVFQ